MTPYEQKVRERAEELATEQYKASFYSVQAGPPMPYSKFNPKSPIAQKAIKCISEHMIPLARLSLQREAEAYRDGFISGAGDAPHVNEYDSELKSLGLVP